MFYGVLGPLTMHGPTPQTLYLSHAQGASPRRSHLTQVGRAASGAEFFRLEELANVPKPAPSTATRSQTVLICAALVLLQLFLSLLFANEPK